ncbi:unnamed protein product [Caenorhabditis bovis]|uniref:Uncharacterized protein n=1 Tax=Caenorhabditis bovis TaxID=2654633 RepID=A0A8S1ED65_9PELO|nr:unnamed protein product [Caenorhabditis bovis]
MGGGFVKHGATRSWTRRLAGDDKLHGPPVGTSTLKLLDLLQKKEEGEERTLGQVYIVVFQSGNEMMMVDDEKSEEERRARWKFEKLGLRYGQRAITVDLEGADLADPYLIDVFLVTPH